VLLFVGDGSFQLTCQEVSTMIRYGLNPIIFLINNDGYLVERDIGEGPFNDLQRWKYAKLPEVFGGGWSAVVKTEDELERALARAWKNDRGLSFIEVVTGKYDSPKAMIKAGAAMAKTNFID
jgi:indolepyruvate decarboxylase